MGIMLARCSAVVWMAGAWAIPALAWEPVPAPPQAPLPPAPINLRLTSSTGECAAAAASFACDAALAAYGQVLIFHWMGDAGIDGYRLYANAGGKPVLQESRFHPDQRVFLIPSLGGAAIADYCFHVRAFSGERESWPTNTVCVEPPKSAPPRAPTPNAMVLAPIGGTLLTGVETHKNFNSGCPFAERTVKTRTKAAYRDGLKATYVYRDAGTVCGERSLIWNEGSAEFALSEVPARFNKAMLKFISEGSGGSCVQEIFAYNLGIQDNSPGGGRYEKSGDPMAWFTYHKTATVATALKPEGGNAFDVTAVVRQSIQRKYKKQGFNFAVNQVMKGGNHSCAAGFRALTLEFE